ncbi:MAG: NAD-dependent epimerase/dehydratase family protein [Gammaproteobacteria bacterium]|nr:NAD-dependent epimerase/dehydratase family protein [Gammaproteobacteria bacterium]
MRAFVAGADGFIGKYLADELESRHCDVTRSVRTVMDHADASVEEQAKALADVDVVFHLAARAHRGSGGDASIYLRDNLETTKRLFEASLRAKAMRFVFVSTLRVLGETSPRPFRAADDPKPADAYSESKARAEAWLETQQGRGVAISIVRPPLVYGPGVRANFLKLLDAVGRGLPLPLGRATAPRSQLAPCQSRESAGDAGGAASAWIWRVSLPRRSGLFGARARRTVGVAARTAASIVECTSGYGRANRWLRRHGRISQPAVHGGSKR